MYTNHIPICVAQGDILYCAICAMHYNVKCFKNVMLCLFWPLPSLVRTAVFGVVVEFSEALVEALFDDTLFQEWHGQLILLLHKHLQGGWETRCHTHTRILFICKFFCTFLCSGDVGHGRRPENKTVWAQKYQVNGGMDSLPLSDKKEKVVTAHKSW